MATPLAASVKAIAWKAVKAQRGETVTYYSGDDSVELTAVFSRPNPQQVDGEAEIVFESRNWDVLIDPTWPSGAPAIFAADYEPEHGDKLVRADGTAYKVQPSDSSDLCWRWADSDKTFRRVFVEAS
jgi:hypothetical protein